MQNPIQFLNHVRFCCLMRNNQYKSLAEFRLFGLHFKFNPSIYILIAVWIFGTGQLKSQNLPDSITVQDTTSKISDTTKLDSLNIPKKKKKGGLNEIIQFEASVSMVLEISKKEVTLYNEASIVTPKTNLESHYIKVSLETKNLFAKGTVDTNGVYTAKPILKDKGETYTADSMQYNSSTGRGKVYGLKLAQDESHIHLGTVLKDSSGSFTGVRGKITTCDADEPHFYLNASRVKVIPDNKALFSAANLVFQGIPTPIALPFGLAPLKKGQRDGILFPSLGFNSFNRSFYLQNFGYYIGLGQHSDIQINTDAYLNGDFRAALQTQYYKRYVFRGTLNLQYSRFSNGAEITSPTFAFSNDFAIRSNFNLDPKYLPGVRLGGNINIVTSGFNQRNSRDINNLSNNQFTSSINYGQSFFKNKVNLSMAARHTQNTQTRDFRLDLPSINLGVSSLTPFASKTGSNQKWYQQLRLSYSGNMQNQINTKDSILFSDRYQDALADFRSGVRHSIPVNTNIKLFDGILNLTPSFNYRENWHFKGVTKEINSIDNSIIESDTSGFFRQYAYSFSSSLKTNIYGTFNGLKLGRVTAIRHTITPRMGISYSPEIDPYSRGWTRTYTDTSGKVIDYNLFSNSPAGNLTQRQTGLVSFGLNNNLQGKKTGISIDSTKKAKAEKFNIIDQLNLSGSYNLFADSLKFSDIRMTFNTVLAKVIRINANANYSPYVRTDAGRTINRYVLQENGSLMRLRSAGININTSLNAKTFKKKKSSNSFIPKKVIPEEEQELRNIENNRGRYYDFNIPWSVNFSYMANYNAETPIASARLSTNRFRISGDISITDNWKIGYQTGYDFRAGSLEGSQFTVARNLHCWQLEFSWVPTGYGKQWVFTLRPVSRLLQDLKLNKRVYSNPALM